MRNIQSSLVGTGFLLCFGVFGLAACGDSSRSEFSYSAPSKTTSTYSKYSRAELEAAFVDLAKFGDEPMRLIVALKTYDPALYNEFIDTILSEIKPGVSDYQVSLTASTKMRPKFMVAFSAAIAKTGDANVNDLVDIGLETYTAFLDAAPQECVRNINGLPPSSLEAIPVDLQQREGALMIRTFEDGVVANARTASEDEVMAWMVPLMRADPKLVEGFTNLALPSPTDEQATVGCESMIALLKDLKQKPASEVAALFRGMAQMQ